MLLMIKVTSRKCTVASVLKVMFFFYPPFSSVCCFILASNPPLVSDPLPAPVCFPVPCLSVVCPSLMAFTCVQLSPPLSCIQSACSPSPLPVLLPPSFQAFQNSLWRLISECFLSVFSSLSCLCFSPFFVVVCYTDWFPVKRTLFSKDCLFGKRNRLKSRAFGSSSGVSDPWQKSKVTKER